MEYDALSYRYPSRRGLVFAKKGMVCATQPLAAQAGLDMLKKGGNAIDAAIATAACLTLIEPTSNGIGSDAFAILWTKNSLHGLNSSGPAPMGLTLKKVKAAGYEKMPARGWLPVTVPGAPAAWAELSRRFGKLPLAAVLEPAARYAEEGFPVTPVTSISWSKGFNIFGKFDEDCFLPWKTLFAPEGRAPMAGEIFRAPDFAKTLRKIGETMAEDFYRGEIAEKIDAFSRATGGYLRKADLESYRPEWVQPLHVNYRGYDVWELPPNGDGITALMALAILKGFEFSHRDCAETFHNHFEAMKLAFTDTMHYVTDPRHMRVTPEQLLSEAYAAERRALIGGRALDPAPGNPAGSGTVYLCAADGEGNMISYIQSNYMGFGSGVVVPGTGISFQNRGYSFSLDENAHNCLAPGKKPFHTIIPGFLTKDGEPVGPFGVMGGYMQPQGHVQVLTNAIDFHHNPQEALDAPRWQWTGGKKFTVEREFPVHIAEQLGRMGHEITVAPDRLSMGRGQIIWKMPSGALAGATEPRADGTVAAW